jgi:N-acetylmuramoyl-L-alanine amidase
LALGVDEMKRVIFIPIIMTTLVLCGLTVISYFNIDMPLKRMIKSEQMAKAPEKVSQVTPKMLSGDQTNIQNLVSILSSSGKSYDTWVITNSVTNVHSSPASEAPIILEAPSQSWFPLLVHSGKWVQIQLGNNQTGWIADWMTQTKNTNDQLQIVNTKADMLMYNGPDQAFLSSGTAHLNTPLFPLEIKGEWVRILAQQTGSTGWIPVNSVIWKPEENNLNSVSVSQTDLPLDGKTIVVDPGHGGSDAGAIGVGKNIFERDINLAVAEVLAAKFKAAGAHVILTRNTNDQFVSLADRVRISNESHADAFISIHQNQYQKDPSVTGAITYYFNSTESKTFASDIEDQSLASLHSQEGKGEINQNELYVLDHNTRPAVLVEGCFLSNMKELENSILPEYQENLASGIYHGVLNYFGKYPSLAKVSN